jgi:hypothetical protein
MCFLQDFGKRVDAAVANLLIFVAFNFTISSDLPRLGYVTFIDAIFLAAFFVTAGVVLVNVIFKRLEVTGRMELARRLDIFAIWVYPLFLTLAIALCWYLFVRLPL